MLICHPQHPFAKLKSVKLKALTGQKIIGFEPDIPTRKALDKILKEHGVEVKHVMEFDNIETVKRAVEIDAGISIVPQGTIAQEIAKQTLAAVAIEDGDFYRPIAAIYKKNKVLSPAMKQFLTILKEGADPHLKQTGRQAIRPFFISSSPDSAASILSAGKCRPCGSVRRRTTPRRRPIPCAGSAPCPSGSRSCCRCRNPRRPGPA